MPQARRREGDDESEVLFTDNALMSMKLRDISTAEVVRTLRAASADRVDPKTGHVVSRSGDVRIVSKRDGASIVVLTAMRTDEFADPAE